MRILLIIVLSISLINCKTEIKDECLPNSLIQKLDAFKFELADSLAVEKKQIRLIDLLIEESTKRKFGVISLIEFDSIEITQLIDCFSNFNNSFSDSNEILWQINNPYKNDVDLYNLIDEDKDLDYLKLFWLYYSIDKSFVSNSIYMKNEREVYLNGKLLNNIKEIRKLFIRADTNIKDFEKRAVISISGHKDSISMDLVDKIENELREMDVLRINYSTTP